MNSQSAPPGHWQQGCEDRIGAGRTAFRKRSLSGPECEMRQDAECRLGDGTLGARQTEVWPLAAVFSVMGSQRRVWNTQVVI